MGLMPTPAEVQYMQQHIGDSHKAGLIAVNVIGLSVAIIAVGLRFQARRLVQAGIKADDWTIVIALILFIGFAISYCVATHFGAGRHAILVTNPKALTETYIVIESFYVLTLVATKGSILLLYNRVFPQKWFRRTLIATGAFLVAWGIAGLFVQIFQCWPIKAQWDPTVPARCINYPDYALTLITTNVVTDIFILALPIRPVWQLRLTTKKKWMLTATFVVGCSACLVSIIRLIYVHDLAISYDSSYTLTRSGEIATCEFIVGILAACFPTYRPLYNRQVGKHQGQTTNVSRLSHTAISRPRLGKEESPIEMEKPASGREGDWISLEDDEQVLVKSTKRDQFEFKGGN